jgi:hypothetical protein
MCRACKRLQQVLCLYIMAYSLVVFMEFFSVQMSRSFSMSVCVCVCVCVCVHLRAFFCSLFLQFVFSNSDVIGFVLSYYILFLLYFITIP